MGVKSLAPSHILTLMKQASIILLMVFCAVLQCFSRSIISGVVKNDEGAAVDFVSVIASPSNAPKTILSSALTDENGKFQISVKSECDSLILKASSVEIAPTEIIVPNRTGNYEIIVENRAVELKEVVVKSKKVYSHGDTINYNVGSFLSQTDQTIADVLRKMPGITVSDAGQVSYQGKPIKNFYIEGLDLMKGHYGIATNNIDPNNIATVQVLENHQDIKALKGLRPEEQYPQSTCGSKRESKEFSISLQHLEVAMATWDYGTTLRLQRISVATASFLRHTRATTPERTCRRSCIPSTTIIRVQAISRQSPCRRLRV